MRVDRPPGLGFEDEASLLQLTQVAEQGGLRDTACARENGRGGRPEFLQEPKKLEAPRVREGGQAEENLSAGFPFPSQALPDAVKDRCGDGHKGVRLRGIVDPTAFTGRVKESARLERTKAQAGLILWEADGGGNLANRFAGVCQDGFQAGQSTGIGQDTAGSPKGWMIAHVSHTFQYVRISHIEETRVNVPKRGPESKVMGPGNALFCQWLER